MCSLAAVLVLLLTIELLRPPFCLFKWNNRCQMESRCSAVVRSSCNPSVSILTWISFIDSAGLSVYRAGMISKPSIALPAKSGLLRATVKVNGWHHLWQPIADKSHVTQHWCVLSHLAQHILSSEEERLSGPPEHELIPLLLAPYVYQCSE